MHEHQLGTVQPLGEIVGAILVMAVHLPIVTLQISMVGSHVERVLHLPAPRGNHLVVGVGQQHGRLRLREFGDEQLAIAFRLLHVAHASRKQEQVVIDIILLLELGIVAQQTLERAESQRMVAQLLHLQDARLVEPLAQHGMRLCHLFLREGNLLKVELPMVRVVGQRVLQSLIAPGLLIHAAVVQRVGVLIVVVLLEIAACRHLLVAPSPVILVLAVAPAALESLTAVLHRHRVVEVPSSLGTAGCHGIPGPCAAHRVLRHGISLGARSRCPTGRRLLGLLLLLLLQSLDDTVDGGQIVLLIHLGKSLETILELHVAEGRCQFVEQLAAPLALGVLLVLLVQQRDALLVGILRLDIILLIPIDLAQAQQQYSLGNAPLGTLLHALLPGVEAVRGVLCTEVDVADGIIYTVEVVLVSLAARHALQLLDHLLVLTARHHLRLHDACVELQFVGRIAAGHLAQVLVGQLVLPRGMVELSQEVVQTSTLQLAARLADALLQVRNGLGILLRGNEEGRQGVLTLPCRLRAHAVAPHLVEDVLSIVGPVQGHVTTGQPGTCHAGDLRLCGIEPCHIAERAGRLEEVALLELCLAHHEPGMAQVGIELLACAKLLLLGCEGAVALLHGFLLDAVQLDGLLTFRYGRLKVALPQGGRGLARTDIHGEQLRVVILVPLLLCLKSVEIGHLTVVECIVVGGKGVPGPCHRGVVLGGTGGHGTQHHASHRKGQDAPPPSAYMPFRVHHYINNVRE